MKISKIVRKTAAAGRRVLNAKLPSACGVVIVAAGTASRMRGVDKIMAPLGGEPVIVHTVRAFQASPVIRQIVIVTREDLIAPITALCAGMDKVTAVVPGGKDRQSSVENGVKALSRKMRLVAVHDGARPLVTDEVIQRVVRAANIYSAAVPVVPVKDTVKVVAGGMVSHTPDRNTLQAVQTPQVFDRDLLHTALKRAAVEKTAVTDDASAVERLDMHVKVVEGDERNIKITTPMDLAVAEILLEETV